MRTRAERRMRMRTATLGGAAHSQSAAGAAGAAGGMQAALEITARYCRSEMEQYGRCVAASPASWQSDCHRLRLDMSRCAAAHPIVQRIRQDCAEPFTAFERCLRENEAAVLNCSEQVDAFLLCADRVKLST